MRRTARGLGTVVVAITLAAAPASAQDVWTAPAPGVQVLRRTTRGATLDVVRVDLDDPQVRLVAPHVDEGAMPVGEFAAEHDALVTLGASAADADALRALALRVDDSTLGDCAALPDRVAGAVGVAEGGRLVLLSSARAVTRSIACETLESLGVRRVRALEAASLRVGDRTLRGAAGPTTALLGVRSLPGATWMAAEPGASGVVGTPRPGHPTELWFEARNTGRRAWTATEAPTLAVETESGTLRVAPSAEVRPGAVARFMVRLPARAAGEVAVSARALGPGGEELFAAPMRARFAVTAPSAAAARAVQVQAAGLSLGGEHGPSGVAWAVLSVLGCAVAALQRRARRDE